jgi:hypothetical protein
MNYIVWFKTSSKRPVVVWILSISAKAVALNLSKLRLYSINENQMYHLVFLVAEASILSFI